MQNPPLPLTPNSMDAQLSLHTHLLLYAVEPFYKTDMQALSFQFLQEWIQCKTPML